MSADKRPDRLRTAFGQANRTGPDNRRNTGRTGERTAIGQPQRLSGVPVPLEGGQEPKVDLDDGCASCGHDGDMPTAAQQLELVQALLAAGVSVREAVKHLVIATRLLEGAGLDCVWLRQTYNLLADLAHELDPATTPYPRDL